MSGLTQVANGIRNTGGILVDTAGNVYFGDNGYEAADGTPISADELNILTAAQIASGNVTSFGYPNSYTKVFRWQVSSEEPVYRPCTHT